jgi:hypothetical protein
VDDIDLGSRLKRVMGDRRKLIQEVLMDGMLKDIEHYKSLQGELTAYKLGGGNNQRVLQGNLNDNSNNRLGLRLKRRTSS